MKFMIACIKLSFLILLFSGFLCFSRAQENSNNFAESKHHQNLRSDLYNTNDTLNNNSWGFWFNLGLGTTNPNINYNYNPNDFITLKPGFNFKYTNYLLSFGLDKSITFPGGNWYIDTYWSTFGYSTNFPHWDASINIGPSYSKWKYLTENENNDIINSPWSLGFIIKSEFLIHMKTGVGIGTILSYNYSKEVKYTSISFVFVLGAWYNKI